MTAQASWSGGSDLAQRGDVEFLIGVEQLRLHSGEIEALAQRCGAPVTGRSSWILATVSHGPEPEIVLVRDSAGFLKAAAVLVPAATSGAASNTVTLAGAGPASQGHRGALLVDEPAYGRNLGSAFRLSLSIDGPRRSTVAEFGPIPADSAGLDELLAAFPELTAHPVEPIPMIQREPGLHQASDYLSDSMRRNLRKATNRLATDGRQFEVRFASSYSDVSALLPMIEACHRDRDHDRGRRSDLDDPSGRQVWYSRLRALARDGLVEIATCFIDRVAAAYVIGIRDRGAYRVLEGYFATEWARYAPGRLLETAVIQRMLDTPSMNLLDWMTSLAPESLIAKTDSQPVVVLRLAPPSSRGDRREALGQ
jgi:hypothetical protein